MVDSRAGRGATPLWRPMPRLRVRYSRPWATPTPRSRRHRPAEVDRDAAATPATRGADNAGAHPGINGPELPPHARGRAQPTPAPGQAAGPGLGNATNSSFGVTAARSRHSPAPWQTLRLPGCHQASSLRAMTAAGRHRLKAVG